MLDRSEKRVLREFDSWIPDFRQALGEAGETSEDGDDILEDARARLSTMIEKIADPGARAPHMRAFTIGGAIYVAVYLALAGRSYDAARVWTICERATRLHFARFDALERTAASSGMFSWPMRALSRWIASRSQKNENGVGGWVLRYVEGRPGEFDYGVDYTRCAIRELAIANGAAAFAPYICLADIAGSEAFGWGLHRTETLAQGGSRCDFRFRRNGETLVQVRLPGNHR